MRLSDDKSLGMGLISLEGLYYSLKRLVATAVTQVRRTEGCS